jgi:ketosteroid isomerase-like protein
VVTIGGSISRSARLQARHPEQANQPKLEPMTTRHTIERYLSSLQKKDGWESHFADDLVFTSFVSPVRRVSGRSAFLSATKGFYGMIVSLEVQHLLVDGDRACATTRYQLQPPAGPGFTSDVAEVFAVRDGLIRSLEIYFDSAPYPRR